MSSSGSLNIYTIISLSIISCCLIISCCGYIVSQKKIRKRQQNQIINNRYAPEVDAHIFTVDMPYTQTVNNEQLSPYLSNKFPPSYETVEVPMPAQMQLDMPAMANNNIEQIQQK